MTGIAIEIARFVYDSYPGFVECKFVDAFGRQQTIIEKVPVVTLEYLDANSAYPQPGIIGCVVVERRQDAEGREIVLVDTELPWHIDSTTGETRFEVLPNQLIEFDWSHEE